MNSYYINGKGDCFPNSKDRCLATQISLTPPQIMYLH